MAAAEIAAATPAAAGAVPISSAEAPAETAAVALADAVLSSGLHFFSLVLGEECAWCDAHKLTLLMAVTGAISAAAARAAGQRSISVPVCIFIVE